MADQSIYEVLIKFGLDDANAKKASRELENIDASSKKANASMSGMGSALKQVGQQALALAGISSIIGTMVTATGKYNSQVGISEKTSRDWIEATTMLENSWVGVGRAIEEFLLPPMQTLAQLMTIVTSPGGIKALKDAAIGAIPGGKELTDKTDKYYEQTPEEKKAAEGKLFDFTPLKKTAEDAWKTIQGIGAINQLQGLKMAEQKGWITPAQMQELGEAVATGLEQAIAQKPRVVNSASMAPGSIQAAMGMGASAPGGGAGGAGFFPLEDLKKFYLYAQQTENIARQSQIQLGKMERDYNIQRTYATEDYQKQLRRSERDFNLSMLYMERDFNRQRAISQRDFGIQLVRNEQDYQRSRNRAAQDHEFDLFQIAMTGDAMQYWLAERAFKIQEERAKEDYELQKNRSKEDFQRSQQDAETEYQIQRARAAEQRAIMLADQAEDFEIQRERQQKAYELQLLDFNNNLKEQKLLREQAFMNEYTFQQDANKLMLLLRQQLGEAELQVFQAMIDLAYTAYDQVANTPLPNQTTGTEGSGTGTVYKPVTKYQAGGYTMQGLGYLHQDEFVMTKETTSAAERAAKTKSLSQAALVAMFTGGSGQGLTYNDHRRFDTKVSAQDREAIYEDTRNILIDLLSG